MGEGEKGINKETYKEEKESGRKERKREISLNFSVLLCLSQKEIERKEKKKNASNIAFPSATKCLISADPMTS